MQWAGCTLSTYQDVAAVLGYHCGTTLLDPTIGAADLLATLVTYPQMVLGTYLQLCKNPEEETAAWRACKSAMPKPSWSGRRPRSPGVAGANASNW
ncbi:hypothetical protein HaLaN_09144 [Haematococcus lacustris]|uniref:Uncharacterized protein n=1 Tax=Haematococcus lacustris TaxID=44745 RepID=A0A699YUS3_HAELA|nr:hypothetical protein HaLaN_09144 [Haematococcus lacustris]